MFKLKYDMFVHSFDHNKRKWNSLTTFPDPQYGYPTCFDVDEGETFICDTSVYVIDKQTIVQYSIWRLDVNSLQWKVLKIINFHNSLRCFDISLSFDGCFVFVENQTRSRFISPKVHRIRANEEVDSLQEICLSKSVEYIESVMNIKITDNSNEQLLKFGFSKEFIMKLRW